jgi:hypothetical protein
MSDRSAQTYERLTEDLELRKSGSAVTGGTTTCIFSAGQMKLLTAVERMKRYQEQCTVQQHIIPSRVE